MSCARTSCHKFSVCSSYNKREGTYGESSTQLVGSTIGLARIRKDRQALTLDGEACGQDKGNEGEEGSQNVEGGVEMHYCTSSEVLFAVESIDLVLRSGLCRVVV